MDPPPKADVLPVADDFTSASSADTDDAEAMKASLYALTEILKHVHPHPLSDAACTVQMSLKHFRRHLYAE